MHKCYTISKYPCNTKTRQPQNAAAIGRSRKTSQSQTAQSQTLPFQTLPSQTSQPRTPQPHGTPLPGETNISEDHPCVPIPRQSMRTHPATIHEYPSCPITRQSMRASTRPSHERGYAIPTAGASWEMTRHDTRHDTRHVTFHAIPDTSPGARINKSDLRATTKRLIREDHG